MREMQVRALSQEDRLEGGNGNPLQDACLGNPMDRGAWWATVRRVTKSQTRQTTPSTANERDLGYQGRSVLQGEGKSCL